MNNPLFEYLRSIPVSEFPPLPKELVVIPGTHNVQQVVDILSKNKITSAPVSNDSAPSGASWVDRYHGIVDMAQVSALAVRNIPVGRDNLMSVYPSTWSHKIMSSTIASEISGETPFVPLLNDSNLLEVMLFLGRYKVHRVPIVSDSSICHLVTQSAVLRQLLEIRNSPKGTEHLVPIMTKTIEELGLGAPQAVMSVDLDTPVVDAFRLMVDNKISGVPVMGLESKIVGNLSVSDIHLLMSDSAKWVKYRSAPVRHFMNDRYNQTVVETGKETGIQRPMTCKAGDSLQHVMEVVTSTRVHRVYLVNDNDHLLRVLSICDLIQVFVKDVDENELTELELKKWKN